MNSKLDQLIERYTITRSDYKKLESLDVEELSSLQAILKEVYDANLEIVVKNFIENTWEIGDKVSDHVNDGFVKTEIYDDPYRLNIFIPDYPAKLIEHNKPKFSTNSKYSKRMRWLYYMGWAIHDLRDKGATKFTEKVIVIAKYHFPGDHNRVVDYTTGFLNDTLKFSELLSDGDYPLPVFTCGVLDKENKGLEITIVSIPDFYKDSAAFI